MGIGISSSAYGFYPRNNPSGFITGVNLSSYATITNLNNTGSTLNIKIDSVSGYLQNQINNISGGGGSGVTGDYYPNSNPSGFITGIDTSSLYPRSNPSGFINNQDIIFSGIQYDFYKKQNNSTAFNFVNVSFPTQTVTLTGIENKYYLINPETNNRILLLSTSGLKTGSTCIIRNASTTLGPNVTVRISGIDANNNIFALPSGINTAPQYETLKYYIFNGTGFQSEYVNYHTHTLESVDGLITALGEKPTTKFVSNLQKGQTLYWTASSANWLNSFLNGGDVKTWMLLTGKADLKVENSISQRAWDNRIHFYITKPLNNFLIDISDNIPVEQIVVPYNYRITNLTSSGWLLQYSGSPTLVESLNINSLQTADFTLTKPPFGGVGPIITNIQYYNLLPNSVVTGDVIRPSETGAFYPRSNPSGFITGIENIVYATGDQTISGIKIFLDNSIFRSGIKIGKLSELSNPIIEFLDAPNGDYNELTWSDSTLSFRNYPDGAGNIGGNAQLTFNFQAIESDGIRTIAVDEHVVHNFGDEIISGLKDFAIRPTVNTVPVALSGEAASNIEQFVKNDYGATLYKAQPVYVSGSNGNNILVHPASNSGEGTSSKTFGLLKQTLLNNEQGYVVTEGPLLNVDTSMAVEGDPIWLGPTGNLIYGLTNKPKAPQHLVSLGFVERAHQTQGKIFVKVQNGFELDELHDVRIINKQNSDIIIYNSVSGLWLNSGVNFDNFYTNNNLSGFVTNSSISKIIDKFTVSSNQPPATGFATLDTRNSILVLDYDDTVNESGTFIGMIPETAGTITGLRVRVLWSAATATSGNCRWGARFADLSSSGIDAPFAIATEVNSAANSISGRSSTAEIICSGTAGLVANEFYRLLVYRNSADTVNDTMSGDAELIGITTYLV